MFNPQQIQEGQSPELGEISERIIESVSDAIWTPEAEGGAFELMLETYSEGGPEALGGYLGNIIRMKVDNMEGGANRDEVPQEVNRDDLLSMGADIINEAYEAIAVQIEAGAQTEVGFPETEEGMQEVQSVTLMTAGEAYTGSADPKLDPAPLAKFAQDYVQNDKQQMSQQGGVANGGV